MKLLSLYLRSAYGGFALYMCENNYTSSNSQICDSIETHPYYLPSVHSKLVIRSHHNAAAQLGPDLDQCAWW